MQSRSTMCKNILAQLSAHGDTPSLELIIGTTCCFGSSFHARWNPCLAQISHSAESPMSGQAHDAWNDRNCNAISTASLNIITIDIGIQKHLCSDEIRSSINLLLH